MKTANEILKELREDNDLKQWEIGRKLGITQQSYSNYESGKSDIPARHIATLAKFYKVSTDFILGVTDLSGENRVFKIPVTKNMSIGNLINETMRLSGKNRKALIDHLELLKIKQKYDNTTR